MRRSHELEPNKQCIQTLGRLPRICGTSGLRVVGRAIYDATFAEITAPFAHSLAGVHAAHGAEILLKARIAEERPLLIFRRLPGPSSTGSVLTLDELLEHGRTVEYENLPDLLWATTGYRLQRVDEYRRLGRLRNRIVHFAVPDIDFSLEVLRFCVEIIEPTVHDFWKCSAIAAAEEWDWDILAGGYLLELLEDLGVTAPECAERLLKREGD